MRDQLWSWREISRPHKEMVIVANLNFVELERDCACAIGLFLYWGQILESYVLQKFTEITDVG